MRQWFESYMTNHPCPSCKGKRLKQESLSVKVHNVPVDEFTSYSIEKALNFVQNLKVTGAEEIIAKPILKEIHQRLSF